MVKIEKLEYQAISKHSFLKGLRDKQMCKDIFNALDEQCLRIQPWKIWTANRQNFPLNMKTNQEGRFLGLSL